MLACVQTTPGPSPGRSPAVTTPGAVPQQVRGWQHSAGAHAQLCYPVDAHGGWESQPDVCCPRWSVCGPNGCCVCSQLTSMVCCKAQTPPRSRTPPPANGSRLNQMAAAWGVRDLATSPGRRSSTAVHTAPPPPSSSCRRRTCSSRRQPRRSSLASMWATMAAGMACRRRCRNSSTTARRRRCSRTMAPTVRLLLTCSLSDGTCLLDMLSQTAHS